MKQRIKTAAAVTAVVLVPPILATALVFVGWTSAATGVATGAVIAYAVSGCAVLLVREARKALRDTSSEEANR